MFGEEAIQAIMKEYKQSDMMEVFERMNPNTLSVEQKKQALRAITLVEKKEIRKNERADMCRWKK